MDSARLVGSHSIVAKAVSDTDRARARRLKTARDAAGMSQEAMGDACRRIVPTFSTVNISRWERGAARPDMDSLALVARVLGVSIDWLVNGTEERVETLPDEVLSLCDLYGIARPTADEARWLIAEPQYHRRTALAVVDTLRTHRAGMTASQAAASDEATARHEDPSVPRRR